MRLFGFGRSQEPDPEFPRMRRREGELLRKELQAVLAESGARARFEGVHAIIEHPAQGRVTVNLENLIHDVLVSQHPKAAKIHARAFLASMLDSEALEQLDVAELYAGLRLRLASNVGLVAEEAEVFNQASIGSFTADTDMTVVLDTERSIQTMPLERLAKLDDVDTLIRAARSNLRHELLNAPISSQSHPGSEEHPGARFRSFESPNYYMASAPLLMNEFLERWASDLDTSLGVLFAVPTRHILLVREITEGEDLLEGLGRMAPVAAQLALEQSHAVSPLLHMVHEGEVSTLSELDEQAHALKIIPNQYLLSLITRE